MELDLKLKIKMYIRIRYDRSNQGEQSISNLHFLKHDILINIIFIVKQHFGKGEYRRMPQFQI